MKKFLLFVAAIASLAFLLMIILDFGYSYVYSHSKPRNSLQYILKLKDEKFDVVFLGSSRVADHIDSELFNELSGKKTINFGVEGANLNDNLLQMELFLKNNQTRFLFLQVDTNLENELPSNISTAEAMPFIKNKTVAAHTQKYLPDFNELYYIPFYRYAINDAKIGSREMLFSLMNKKPGIDPSKGFTPRYGNHIRKGKKEIMGENVTLVENKILNEFRILCNKHQIKLVLFMTPVCSFNNPKSYVVKIKKIVPDLIDLTQNYPDTLFYDCGHLNETGARLFTKELYETTKEMIE